MRYGLLADVHANLPALRAAVGMLEGAGVDRYLIAGDVVGYGPHPNECVELVAQLPGACVAGNHDLIAIGALSGDDIGELAAVTLAWTATVLAGEARTWLSRLPARVRIEDVVVAHGSLADPRRYVRDAGAAVGQLASLAREEPGASILVLGHTHRAMVVGERSGRVRGNAPGRERVGTGERWVLNPGAVGQSRDVAVVARAAVLDVGERRIDLHEVEYDVASTRDALRRAGLPPSAVQLAPASRADRLRGVLPRTLGRVTAALQP